jgi:hypothetical protein
MADESVEQRGQGELERYEITRTSSSSGVSLSEVISSPSVREKGVWSAFLATSCNSVLREHIRQISRFQCFTKNQDEPELHRR